MHVEHIGADEVIAGANLAPVSETHLDVYKRQHHARSLPAGRRGLCPDAPARQGGRRRHLGGYLPARSQGGTRASGLAAHFETCAALCLSLIHI